MAAGLNAEQGETMRPLFFGPALVPTALLANLGLSAIALAEPIETQKIITGLSGDWNGDGAVDLALIVETEPTDPMDIHFFLRDKERDFLRPAEVVREQIYGEWNGFDRPGYENSDTEPGLTALPNGSIKLYMPALPIGSERTNQTLTIAYRDGDFIVAGFTYDYDDALQENVVRSCDYNVLTGKGTASKTQPDGTTKQESIAVEGQVIAFRDWNPGIGSAACGD
jgi:hypothetical protein